MAPACSYPASTRLRAASGSSVSAFTFQTGRAFPKPDAVGAARGSDQGLETPNYIWNILRNMCLIRRTGLPREAAAGENRPETDRMSEDARARTGAWGHALFPEHRHFGKQPLGVLGRSSHAIWCPDVTKVGREWTGSLEERALLNVTVDPTARRGDSRVHREQCSVVRKLWFILESQIPEYKTIILPVVCDVCSAGAARTDLAIPCAQKAAGSQAA